MTIYNYKIGIRQLNHSHFINKKSLTIWYSISKSLNKLFYQKKRITKSLSYEPLSLLISVFNELEPMLRRLTVRFNFSQDLHQQGIEI